MSTSKIEACIQFVSRLTENNTIKFKKAHPWRHGGLHILQHGLRVSSIALEIMANEEQIFDEEAKEIIQIAGILHDIGSIQQKAHHSLISVEMCKAFLSTITEGAQYDEILSIIGEHSSKSDRNTTVLSNIFKDADLIDEYGVQSLLMCANWVDETTPFFFKELEKRVGEEELSFGERLLTLVYTESGKRLVKDKIDFMNQLHKQLKYENLGSLDYETYLNYRG